MRRLLIALSFFMLGLGFVGFAFVLPLHDCNESCPDWLVVYTLAYYLLPVAWLGAGLWSSAPSVGARTRLTRALVLAMINGIALAVLYYSPPKLPAI